MTSISFSSFADEFVKLAVDERKIYSPGIVAHEGGHARVHAPTIRDMALQYGSAAIAIGGNYLGSKAKDDAQRDRIALAADLMGDTLTLADEYTSSLVGMKKVIDQKKYRKRDIAHEAGRLLSAAGTYTSGTVGRLAYLLKDPAKRERLATAANVGGAVGIVASMSHTGPKISAREAKSLVDKIAPGTDVYASRLPMSGGSVYVNKSYTPIGRTATRLLTMGMGLKNEDAKRISRKGGVIIAPVTPVASVGLSLAQQYVQQLAGPIPIPNLTLPGSNIERVPAEGE